MIHQFAHGGDLHLGPNARNGDRRRVFDQFVQDVIALPHLAATLLPGDLNHGRMTIDDRNYLSDRLVTLANRAPVLIARGNHDLPGDLDIFRKLATSYPIHVSTTPEVVAVRTATGAKASIFCLPYPTEGELVTRGVAPGDVVQTARAALDAIFQEAGAELHRARTRGDITLAIGHVNVGGSLTSAGQPNIGQEIEIDEALIQMLGPCYVGLNHIHVGQEIAGAWYPGSFCRLDWSEVDPKRWLLVEYYIDTNARTYTVLPKPVDVAPMWHLEGEVTRESLTLTVDPGTGIGPMPVPDTTDWSAAEVRARVRVNASERELLADAKVRIEKAVGPCLRLEIELIAVPDRALRAPAVAAAKTLADKVGAWADLNGAVVTADVLALLPGLEHGEPDVLRASLTHELEVLTGARNTAVAA